jgi:hypothetical protein
MADKADKLDETPTNVHFLKMWSSDRGLFMPDDGAKGKYTLPAYIALSLLAEGVVELL